MSQCDIENDFIVDWFHKCLIYKEAKMSACEPCLKKGQWRKRQRKQYEKSNYFSCESKWKMGEIPGGGGKRKSVFFKE